MNLVSKTHDCKRKAHCNAASKVGTAKSGAGVKLKKT